MNWKFWKRKPKLYNEGVEEVLDFLWVFSKHEQSKRNR